MAMHGELMNLVDQLEPSHDQLDQSAVFVPQPVSNAKIILPNEPTNIEFQLQMSNEHEIETNEPIFLDTNSIIQTSSLSSVLPSLVSNAEIPLPNEPTNDESQFPMPNENEIETNEPIFFDPNSIIQSSPSSPVPLSPVSNAEIILPNEPTNIESQLQMPNEHEIETIEHEILTIKHESETIEQEIETIKHDIETIKHEIETIEHEIETNEHEFETNEPVPFDPNSIIQTSSLSPFPPSPVSNTEITLPNEPTNVKSQLPMPNEHEIETNESIILDTNSIIQTSPTSLVPPSSVSNNEILLSNQPTNFESQLQIPNEQEIETNKPIPFHPNSIIQSSSTSQVPPSPESNAKIILPSENTNIEQSQLPIPNAHEIETNEQIQCNVIANEQSNHLNSNDPNLVEDKEDECDCNDCENVGEIRVKEEGEVDNVKLIDNDQNEEEEELPKPAKRPRLDSPQPINAQQLEAIQQGSSQPSDESQTNQVNNNNQFITIHLQCPHCPYTFPENQLPQHMFDVHSIRPFQCLVKDCAQSFDTSAILRQHIEQSHQSTTKWHCAQCSKHFARYQTLSNHIANFHQIGLFQCAVPGCTFTGEWPEKMRNHVKYQHQPELVCPQAGCTYRANQALYMRAHVRSHLGIKPYRCSWPYCDYASSHRNGTLVHIRSQHLARLEGANQNVAHSIDPKFYLEVDRKLLSWK